MYVAFRFQRGTGPTWWTRLFQLPECLSAACLGDLFGVSVVAGLRRVQSAARPSMSLPTSRCPLTLSLWALPNFIVSPHMSGDFYGWERPWWTFPAPVPALSVREAAANVVDQQLGCIPGNPVR